MQIKSYEKDGYVLLRNVIPSETIKYLVQATDESVSCGTNSSLCEFYYETSLCDKNQKILRRIEKAANIPAFKDFVYSTLVANIFDTYLGKKHYLFKDKINFKMPGGAGFGYHIDGHFTWIDAHNNRRKGWREYGKEFVNFVLPLDACTLENGCLELANKSCTTSFLGRDWDNINSSLLDPNGCIKPEDLHNYSFEAVEMQPGDVLLFNWLNAHGSQPNLSNCSRRIFYATYVPREYGDTRAKYYSEKMTSIRTELQKVLL